MHIHSRAQASYISTCGDIYISKHVHCRQTSAHTFITASIPYTHTCMHIWIHAYMHKWIRACMHICARMRTPIRAYKQPWQLWPSKPLFSWFIHQPWQRQSKVNNMLINLQYALRRTKHARNDKRSMHNPNTQTALSLIDSNGRVSEHSYSPKHDILARNG